MSVKLISVLDLRPKEKGRVWIISNKKKKQSICNNMADFDGGYGKGKRLGEVLGIYKGQILEVLENRGGGPVILRVGNSRFVLGRDQAACILVEPVKEVGR